MTVDNLFYILSSIGLVLLILNLVKYNSQKLTLSALSLIALACIIPANSLRTDTELSAGSFPFTLCILLLLSLLISIFRTKDAELENLSGTRFVLFIILLSAGYLFLASYLGYYSATIIFIGTCASLLGNKKYITLTAATACWCIFAYYVFEKMLSISLPQGVLF